MFVSFFYYVVFLILSSQVLFSQGGDVTDKKPKLSSSADYVLKNGRNIKFHESANLKARDKVRIYFHRPLFIFDFKDSSIILSQKTKGNYTYYKLKLNFSSQNFRELSKDVIIKEDPALKNAEINHSEYSIIVKPWPIRKLKLDAIDSRTNEFFGYILTKEMRSVYDSTIVSLKVHNNDTLEFEKALSEKEVEFKPYYTYANVKIATAKSITMMSSTVLSEVVNGLENKRINPDSPLLQSEYKDIVNEISQKIVSTITATDANLIQYIKPTELSHDIFVSKIIPFTELSANDNLLEKVTKYLEPILTKFKESNTETTDLTETNTRSNSVSPTLKLPEIGDIGITDEQIKSLKKNHKITITKDSETEIYKFKDIEIHYLKRSWSKFVARNISTIYLAVGIDDSFEEGTSFKPDLDIINIKNKDANENSIVSDVPKGTIVFSLRKDIPKGWVVLDGNAGNYPDEFWVPDHLKGTALPNLSSTFLRGTNIVSEIGTINQGRNISYGKAKLNLEGLSLKKNGSVSNLNHSGRLIHVSAKDDNGRTIHSPIFKEIKNVHGKLGPAELRIDKKNHYDAIEGDLIYEGFTIDFSDANTSPTNIVGRWIMRIH